MIIEKLLKSNFAIFFSWCLYRQSEGTALILNIYLFLIFSFSLSNIHTTTILSRIRKARNLHSFNLYHRKLIKVRKNIPPFLLFKHFHHFAAKKKKARNDNARLNPIYLWNFFSVCETKICALPPRRVCNEPVYKLQSYVISIRAMTSN